MEIFVLSMEVSFLSLEILCIPGFSIVQLANESVTLVPEKVYTRLHVKADVEADVEPIADVEKIQTKTKTERKRKRSG